MKAEHYCAYQERAQQEIRNKLYEWGLHSADVEEPTLDAFTFERADNFSIHDAIYIRAANEFVLIAAWTGSEY